MDAKTVVAYDVRTSFKTLDGTEEAIFFERWEYSVQELLNGGAVKLKVEKTLTKMSVDGTVTILHPETTVTSEERSPRGQVRDRKPSDDLSSAYELRLLRIGDIVYPPVLAAADSAWTETSAPTNDGLPAATWKWTSEKSENGVLKGTFTFLEAGIEKPIQAEGTFSVSLTDGWPVEIAFKAINTYQPGDEEKLPTVYEFSMKRRAK